MYLFSVPKTTHFFICTTLALFPPSVVSNAHTSAAPLPTGSRCQSLCVLAAEQKGKQRCQALVYFLGHLFYLHHLPEVNTGCPSSFEGDPLVLKPPKHLRSFPWNYLCLQRWLSSKPLAGSRLSPTSSFLSLTISLD